MKNYLPMNSEDRRKRMIKLDKLKEDYKTNKKKLEDAYKKREEANKRSLKKCLESLINLFSSAEPVQSRPTPKEFCAPEPTSDSNKI